MGAGFASHVRSLLSAGLGAVGIRVAVLEGFVLRACVAEIFCHNWGGDCGGYGWNAGDLAIVGVDFGVWCDLLVF